MIGQVRRQNLWLVVFPFGRVERKYRKYFIMVSFLIQSCCILVVVICGFWLTPTNLHKSAHISSNP